MSRDALLYLEDMLEACRRVMSYSVGMAKEQFLGDQKCMDAVIRNLEILGEAAKRVPQEIKDRNNSVEWKRMMGLRDILAHDYFGIDEDILWDVVSNKVGPLSSILKVIVERESSIE